LCFGQGVVLVTRMRRVLILLLAILTVGVVLGGFIAQAGHMACREITVGSYRSITRKVCYPCPASSWLPAGTAENIRQLWDAEVCPAPPATTP
jgi:hypothetical protein